MVDLNVNPVAGVHGSVGPARQVRQPPPPVVRDSWPMPLAWVLSFEVPEIAEVDAGSTEAICDLGPRSFTGVQSED